MEHSFDILDSGSGLAVREWFEDGWRLEVGDLSGLGVLGGLA